MKTPRDILFHRHRAAESKLNALRHEVVAQLAPVATERPDALPWRVAFTLWRELILPAHRIWAGLACAWVLLLLVNSQLAPPPRATVAGQDDSSMAFWQRYQEERRFFAELSGVAGIKAVPPAQPFTPRPRSERPFQRRPA